MLTSFLDHNVSRLHTLLTMWQELTELREQLDLASSSLRNHVRDAGTEVTGEFQELDLRQVDEFRERVAAGLLKVLEEEHSRLSASEQTEAKAIRQEFRHGEAPLSSRRSIPRSPREPGPPNVNDRGPGTAGIFEKSVSDQLRQLWRTAELGPNYDVTQWQILIQLLREAPGLSNV